MASCDSSFKVGDEYEKRKPNAGKQFQNWKFSVIAVTHVRQTEDSGRCCKSEFKKNFFKYLETHGR